MALRGAAGHVIDAGSGRGSVGRSLSAVFAVVLYFGKALALERHLLSVLSSLRSWWKTSLVLHILGGLSALEAVL